MRHWYGYHSSKAMKHSYASVGSSAIYTSKTHESLALGDIVWVVEGDLCKTTNFQLVDCFRIAKVSKPPFAYSYEKYRLKLEGHRSMLPSPIPLNKRDSWFALLHAKYITKQRFFNELMPEPVVLTGLMGAANITAF